MAEATEASGSAAYDEHPTPGNAAVPGSYYAPRNPLRVQPVEVIARALHTYEDQIVEATPERDWDYLQPKERQQYLDRAQAALDALRDDRFAVVDATPHGEACRD